MSKIGDQKKRKKQKQVVQLSKNMEQQLMAKKIKKILKLNQGINMSCLINEEIMERLYEDFLEILTKDNKLPLEQREKEAVLLAKEEFNKQQKEILEWIRE